MGIATSFTRAPKDSRLNTVLQNNIATRCAIRRPYSCGKYQEAPDKPVGLCVLTNALCYFAAIRVAKLLL